VLVHSDVRRFRWFWQGTEIVGGVGIPKSIMIEKKVLVFKTMFRCSDWRWKRKIFILLALEESKLYLPYQQKIIL